MHTVQRMQSCCKSQDMMKYVYTYLLIINIFTNFTFHVQVESCTQ